MSNETSSECTVAWHRILAGRDQYLDAHVIRPRTQMRRQSSRDLLRLTVEHQRVNEPIAALALHVLDGEAVAQT